MWRRVAAAMVICAACAGVTLQLCAVAEASYIGHRFARASKTSGSHWDGVRVQMEVKSGEIGSGDAGAGRFVANTLWVFTDDAATDEWVEAGYTRGWNGNDTMTGYWASQRWSESQGQYVYAEHRAVNCTWSGGDWHWFKIMHHSGTTTGDCSWLLYIDGGPVQSADGVTITTSHEKPYSCRMAAGLEVTASSGKLGAASNWCKLYSLSATTDEQGSWSNFNDPGSTVDAGYDLHARWHVKPVDYENYRNW